MENPALHTELRKLILSKAKVRASSKDASKLISQQIFSETKNYVSEISVRRFLNGNDNGNPSMFVLNSLVLFVGFADWGVW